MCDMEKYFNTAGPCFPGNYFHEKSLSQFAGYLDRLGLNEGWMPVFDGDKSKSWEEKIFLRDEVVDGRSIHVVGL